MTDVDTSPRPPVEPRTALVTGAGRGIGRGLALGLAAAGYDVGLVLSAPGGLFEVSVGFYLLAKGFRETMPSTAAATSGDHTLVPRADVAASGAHA